MQYLSCPSCKECTGCLFRPPNSPDLPPPDIHLLECFIGSSQIVSARISTLA